MRRRNVGAAGNGRGQKRHEPTAEERAVIEALALVREKTRTPLRPLAEAVGLKDSRQIGRQLRLEIGMSLQQYLSMRRYFLAHNQVDPWELASTETNLGTVPHCVMFTKESERYGERLLRGVWAVEKDRNLTAEQKARIYRHVAEYIKHKLDEMRRGLA